MSGYPSEREWARYDREVDAMPVERLRATLKAEARLRARWQIAAGGDDAVDPAILAEWGRDAWAKKGEGQ